ncbi:MAG: sigma-54-dependent transcriptional regulator [Sphingomonas sp.]
MSIDSPQILVVDDDADIIKAAGLVLRRAGMVVSGAADPEAAWVIIGERPPDVIMLDLNFARGRTSGDQGFAMLERLMVADRDAVVVVVTGHSGIAVAVRAMKSGASDFVIKPWSNERLLATMERAVALRRARRVAAPPVEGDNPLVMIGESHAINSARALTARIAATDASVLVRGPAGTGKTLLACAIHRASARRDAPLVSFNAATSEASLADARGATLLIEDVEQLLPEDQRLLARSTNDIRLIATSRLDRVALRSALSDDVLYRLTTIEIDLPPLTGRPGDTLLLAQHFAARFAARYGRPLRPLTDEAARAIAADPWPDNVHGLRQALERAVLLGTGDTLGIDDFAQSIAPGEVTPRAIAASLNLATSEKALVEAALKRHAYNVSRAAAELGLTRATLYRRMARHGL